MNKILVDRGATVNLMSHMLRRIGMFDTDLKPNNMILSNCEGKIGHSLGVILVELTIVSIIKPTMFMVITSCAS